METDQNPADDASCGQNAQNLIENLRWWNGPEFLWKPLEDQSSPDGAEPMCISPDDSESKDDFSHDYPNSRMLLSPWSLEVLLQLA